MGSVYYNDHDPDCVRFLRRLIGTGRLPLGWVDGRDVEAVRPGDVAGRARCHYFAGIGGWELACQLAEWPDDRELWTASLPCQPFSTAGAMRGLDDDRHLWPVFEPLVRERRPFCIAGEQVVRAIEAGWVDAVRAALEQIGYRFGFVVLGAHSVGAPHVRQRVFWIADLAGPKGTSEADPAPRLGDAAIERLEAGGRRPVETVCATGPRPAWVSMPLRPCRDGVARPLPDAESGIYPLAPRVPGRMAMLRCYGNSIVPQVAAGFLRAYLDLNP